MIASCGAPWAARAKTGRLCAQLPDAGDLLDRPADAAQPPGAIRSQPVAYAHCIPVCGVADALLHLYAGRIHSLSPRPAGVLAEYSGAGIYLVSELELCT